jgi:hypothetical protein
MSCQRFTIVARVLTDEPDLAPGEVTRGPSHEQRVCLLSRQLKAVSNLPKDRLKNQKVP